MKIDYTVMIYFSVVLYGNRDYYDALLELNDIAGWLSENCTERKEPELFL